jgi:ribosomal protein S18 acetylase RimI-like enzyme
VSSVDLQELGPEDWRAWRELRRRALADAPRAFTTTLAEWSGAGDDESRWRHRLGAVAVNLVAAVGDAKVGMASATSPENDEVELISMWVAPEARKSGVATALIEAIVRWASAEGVARVALDVRDDNLAAIALYRACGFADAGQSPNSEPGAPERRMLRSLR